MTSIASPSSTTTNYYFRLRSIEKLLRDPYKELEAQSIYFASPEELNDPMEGFRDLFWQGDEIVWANFFKHYLRCVGLAFTFLILSGEKTFGWADIYVENPAHANAPQGDAIEEQVFSAFFSEPAIRVFVDGLAHAKHPIRRDELSSYIRMIHPYSALLIQKVYSENRLSPPPDVPSEVWNVVRASLRNLAPLLQEAEKMEKRNEVPSDARDVLFSVTRNMTRQVDLIDEYNRREKPDPRDTPNKQFFYFQFPMEYVDQLDRLAYPKWHTACFMSDIANSSLWGSYAEGHTGVALKFRAHKGQRHPTLPLLGVNGWSREGPLRGFIQHEFIPVIYGRSHVAIDFFATIGNMPASQLNKYWYLNSKGERSTRANSIFEDESSWRAQYWENYSKITSTKLDDWKHENEHRLIFSSSLTEPKSERALKYDFQDLDGIVFGLKTNSEDKLSIMKIIETKCRAENRFDFHFYQSYFSSTKGVIEHGPLSLLKFKR